MHTQTFDITDVFLPTEHVQNECDRKNDFTVLYINVHLKYRHDFFYSYEFENRINPTFNIPNYVIVTTHLYKQFYNYQ